MTTGEDGADGDEVSRPVTESVGRTRYLFHEETVADRLEQLPATRARLFNAAERDTRPSSAYVGYATNPRQLYRILAGASVYPWLEAMLGSVEACMTAGWYARKIMSSDRQNFRGAVAEAHVAEHFLLRLGEVDSEPEVGSGRADLRIPVERGDALVEVVAPIKLAALNDFFEVVKDTLKNVDVPLDFVGRVRLSQLRQFDDRGTLLISNPIELAQQLNETTLIADIAAETLERLVHGEDFHIEHGVPELNLLVTAEFTDVAESTGGPVREIFLDLPTLSGYAPEAIYDSILDTVANKANRRQAGDVGDTLRLLVVDLSTGEVSSELLNPIYRGRFEQMAVGRLGGQIGSDYDAVALVEPRGWGEELILHQLLFESDRLDLPTAERLFGPLGRASLAGNPR